MNVGATGVTDYGLYFQWGDTQGYTASQVGEGEGKKYFGDNDNIYFSDGSYTKYNDEDGLTTLEASDDAVHAAWGGSWRMPTTSEFQVLKAAVTTQWVSNYQGSGVNGRLMTDKTDSSKVLFFPACGYVSYGSLNGDDSDGYYWSSSLNADCGEYGGAYYLFLGSDFENWQDYSFRFYGFAVRGVLDE